MRNVIQKDYRLQKGRPARIRSWHFILLSSLFCTVHCDRSHSSAVAADKPATAAAKPITPQQEEFFERKVRPLLSARCWKCHGSKKQEGGLRLDTRSAMVKGGESGPALVPGKPDQGLLVEAIGYKGLEMPPDGKLKAAEIAVLLRWIKMGAPWPTGKIAPPKTGQKSDPQSTIRDVAKTHWAFQPVRKPVPPVVKDRSDWVRNDIDRFVWAKLRQKALAPSPRADRKTLLRRAYFDLIGMPPTPAEAKRFLSDRSADAFARLVDRLLSDPRYGERWGRHWLDVARYSDTKGAIFGEPRFYPYAYTYRDYVIAAFNDDKPYDQFLREQLAADLYTDRESDSSLAALGFLTVHRRSNAGGAQEQWIDRIDTITRGLLGLTVACARCHDHKYDPIPTADFYSLLGVVASIEEPKELPIISRPPPGSALDRSYRKFLVEEDKKRQEFITRNHRKIMKRFRGQVGRCLLAVHDGRDLPSGKLRVLAGRRKLSPEVTVRWKDYLEKHPHDAVFGAWQAFSGLSKAKFARGAAEISTQIAANKLPRYRLNPLIAAAFKGDPPRSLEEVAERYQRVFNAADQSTAHTDRNREQLRRLLHDDDSPGVMPAGNFKQLDRLVYLKLLGVEADRRFRLVMHPGSPRRAMVVRDMKKPYDSYIYIRGNKDRHGRSVPRQFLEILSGPGRRPFQHGSGRRELAEAIASPKNPLTARVMVNRVWLHHFGQGLVQTPSDFGLRADLPSHPKLLDWLAATFVNQGWSIKQLHRLVMNSAVYQQSSHSNDRQFAVDPDNRLLWRYNRWRLEYEAIHDSLLSVSGKLDSTRGGPPVAVFPASKRKGGANWPINPYRRAVYGVIDRDRLPAVLPTFDFASPDTTNPRRDITTVPTQSLYMMNNDFVMEMAAALAHRSRIAGSNDVRQRVRQLYQTLFSRDPSRGELALAVPFLKHHAATQATQPKAAVWRFGYGGFDAAKSTHDLSRIRSFPYLGPTALQGSAAYPDKKNSLGWLRLTATGGHAGGSGHCLVRRWTSPVNGTVSLTGILKHTSKKGNGVRATIYGPAGRLGQWTAHNKTIRTTVPAVRVKKGDTIDFVIDDRGNGFYAGFRWAPQATLVNSTDPKSSRPIAWSSKRDFPKPQLKRNVAKSAPFGRWEQFVQVLLMSNEFVFVE